ncbi:hypothetical protein [Adlercreutzia caecimuris]|uniref:Uncharacterized protein n=4 Tax=Adlercreutzia caecimuris TaxID=671266 RepID=R9KUJ3_9ACTN|nr:hypothetical protein [Adlercreutzia caecimuris]EOS49958.1 hypothetical protein C811_02423 [Adlercreutzia caecimuris B7]MCR2037655.1 V-type proton ATPase subunit G [Adlercreutzia caecimuris]THG37927.1 hypothetical protein E5986_03440 [Adlercreutzia caecimuris]
MGTNEDARGAAGTPGAPDYPQADPAGGRQPQGSRGKITTRPSRESILQSYASQDEMRARNARLRSQQAAQSYVASAAQRDADRMARQEALAAQQREQEAYRAQREAERAARLQGAAGPSVSASRRTRVVPPLSSQESYDMTRSSMESYERARASRDALSETRRSRALNREVIDGRGSIDSRTFNESHQISGYSHDDRDRHDPMVDTVAARTNWRSRAGQGFEAVSDGGVSAPLRSRASRASEVGFSGVMSGRANYSAPSGPLAAVPSFLKVTVPIIVVLLAIILFLIFFK